MGIGLGVIMSIFEYVSGGVVLTQYPGTSVERTFVKLEVSKPPPAYEDMLFTAVGNIYYGKKDGWVILFENHDEEDHVFEAKTVKMSTGGYRNLINPTKPRPSQVNKIGSVYFPRCLEVHYTDQGEDSFDMLAIVTKAALEQIFARFLPVNHLVRKLVFDHEVTYDIVGPSVMISPPTDTAPVEPLGVNREYALRHNSCVRCIALSTTPDLDFKEKLNRDRYNIFALCQRCQDELPELDYSNPSVNF